MPKLILADTFNVAPAFFSQIKENPDPVFISQQNNPDTIQSAFETNPYKFELDNVQSQVDVKGGWVKMSNKFLFPALENLSMYGVSLNSGGAREPHWHPNAHELNYLVSGTARISILSPDGEIDTFDMVPGDMSFLPRGYIHYIENTGEYPAFFAIFFNHVTPSDIGISGCLGAFSNEVLASVFKVNVETLQSLSKFQEDLFIVSGGG